MVKQTPVGMPVAEIPNRQVAESGKQFRQTADFLFAHLPEHNCVSPLLMVGAFGIELYLKSLNSNCVYHQDKLLEGLGGYRVTAKPIKWGHSLVVLFDEIDEQFKGGLELAYASHGRKYQGATLREALGVYDTLFVDSRYPFENSMKDGLNIDGLVGLLRFIADHVHGMPRHVSFPLDDSA